MDTSLPDRKSDPAREAQCAATPPAEEPWSAIELRFRVWSFRVYYEKCFASELNNTLRFAKALMASCRPIRDPSLIYTWYRDRKQRRRRGRTRHGAAVTPA